jgi:DNA polymerase III gamma/tau subunit
MYFSPIEAGERGKLADYLSEWEEGVEQTFEKDAKTWLTNNAPIRIVSVKSQSGKREVEAYDLEWMENELDKVLVVKNLEGGTITVADLTSIVRFEQDVDIWKFIDAATSGDSASALKMLKAISSAQGSQGALLVLLSQFEFLMSVKSLILAGIKSPDQIADCMAVAPYIGRYLLPDWTEPTEIQKPNAPNVWRIRKTLERQLPSIDTISRNYQAVISAIRDLRASLDENIVFTYLALTLASEANYQEPLIGAF